MKPNFRPFAVLAITSSIAVACSDSRYEKIDSRRVTSTTRTSVAGHLSQINEAIDLVGDAPFFADLDRMFDPVAEPIEEPITGLDQEEVDEIADQITDRFFSADTIESETDIRVVYRIRGTRVCDGDLACIEAFEDVAVRLEVTSPAEDALDIRVLVGEAQVNPVSIHLDPTTVSVTVDVAGVRAAAELFAPHLDIGPSELPSTALGNFTVAMTKNADRDYTATLSINETIDVESTHPDFPARLSIAARNLPVISTRLDGNARRLYGDVDFAAIDAAMPAAFLLEELTCSYEETDCGPFHGTLSAHLAGASASVELTSSLDRLLINNVGIGDDTSRVMLDETNLIDVDLNELSGRRFDVELSTFDDFLEASIADAFVLDLGLDLANIADQVDDLPTWTLDERLQVSFEGVTPAIRIGNGEDHTINSRPVSLIGQVLSGELNLRSEAITTVEVLGGECLYFANDADDSAHPFSAMISHSCP